MLNLPQAAHFHRKKSPLAASCLKLLKMSDLFNFCLPCCSRVWIWNFSLVQYQRQWAVAGRARVIHNTLLLFYSPKSFAFYISLLSKCQESLLFMLMFADRLFLPWGMRAEGNKLWECFMNFKFQGCLLLPDSINFWNLTPVAQFLGAIFFHCS